MTSNPGSLSPGMYGASSQIELSPLLKNSAVCLRRCRFECCIIVGGDDDVMAEVLLSAPYEDSLGFKLHYAHW